MVQKSEMRIFSKVDGRKGGTCEIKSVCKNKVVMIFRYTFVHAVILNVLLKVAAMEKMKTFHDLMLTFI